jgi:hypothetical protein
MGIDGIGRGGDAPKVGGPSGPAVGGPDEVRFELSTESTEGAERAEGAELLERVQRGEVHLDAYLDVRVNDAVGHLQGKLSPEQLEFVKEELREQLRNDPVLIELVRGATGQSPEPPDL